MNPKKILLVAGVFPPGIGGMQNYYYNLAVHTKHEMTVLASEYAESETFDRKQKFKIVRGAFLRNEKADLRSWGRLFRSVRKMLKHDEPDVTVYGYVLIGFIGLLLRYISGRPYVISTHGMDLLMFRRFPGFNQIVKLILRKADGVMANSEFTKNLLGDYGVDPHRIGIVYPGVEGHFNRQPKDQELVRQYGLEGKYVILSVGRLVTRKGQDRVIAAMPEILGQIPNAVYLVVGDGPDRKRLEQLAKDNGVEDAVIFAGSVSGSERLNAFYNLGDQFIMACRQLTKGDAEGFGIVYLEAASAGIPVIAGRSGGATEAVLDEVTGLLADPESPADIAAQIIRFQTDPALRVRLTEAGYKRAKTEFQHGNVAETFDVYISRLCSRTAPSRKRAEEPVIGKLRP